MKIVTIQPIVSSDVANDQREFGRTGDVQRIFGMRRGTLYNLWHDGKIRGVLLRVRGQKSGVRLWDIASIREFIDSQAEQRIEEPQ
jgi:hypothetical protein